MIIALDFDDTYTINPTMWDSVIDIFKSNGFDMLICTARLGANQMIGEKPQLWSFIENECEGMLNPHDIATKHNIPLIFAGNCRSKREALELAGFPNNTDIPFYGHDTYKHSNVIWVDDFPENIIKMWNFVDN